VGIGLAALGGLYSWIAPTAVHLIFSRGLIGVGYGLALMASQGFVIGNTDGRSKAHGLAHLFAGLYAGSICGGAMGGILAERYGYKTVFLLGALIIALVIPYALIFLRSAVARPQSRPAALPQGTPRWDGLRRFLGNRGVLALILFSSLPASVAVVGFLNYFSPLYLHRLGASESTIGQVLVIYGICLIFVGPAMGRHIDASQSKRKIIFAGCLLGSAAFFSFTLAQGILAAVIAVFLLGLSHSLVLSSQSAYMLKFQVTQNLGEGKALGIFRSSARLGQMLGPMIFSGLAVSTSMRQGALVLGAVYLVVALLFLLLTARDQRLLATSFQTPIPVGTGASAQDGPSETAQFVLKKPTLVGEPIALAPRLAEADTRRSEARRKTGDRKILFYDRKKKYGRFAFAEARRLQRLEEENRQLQKRVDDLSLEKQMLEDLLLTHSGLTVHMR
jgi:predicted MFS family arabinose efflux permease